MKNIKNLKSGNIAKGIKDIGFRLTGTRKTILDTLTEIKKTLSAEEIFIFARKKDPGIGIATIYRNINMLTEHGFIKKISAEKNKTSYILSDDVNSDKNTSKVNTKVVQQFNNPASGLLTVVKTLQNGRSNNNDYYDIAKIDKIQTQLNEWMSELNKISREKEFKLEEIINDFSKVDAVLEKHKYENGNLIQMLIDFQDDYNWLPKHVLLYVSNKMNIPLTQIYGIASFYKFFNLEPRGKYQILVCAGTACHVRGSINLLQRIVNVIKIEPGDTTSDLKFTLDTVNCLGCCALGPVMMFNNKYYSNPSRKELENLFDSV